MAFAVLLWALAFVVGVVWFDLDPIRLAVAYVPGGFGAVMFGYIAYEKGLNRAGYLTELKDGTHRVGTLKGTGTGNVEVQWYNPRSPK